MIKVGVKQAIEVSPTFMPQIRSFITQGKLDGAQVSFAKLI